MEYFRIGGALKVGWEKYKSHVVFVWITIGTIIVVSGIFGGFEEMTKDIWLLSFTISLASAFFSIVMQIGVTRLYLDLIDTDTEGQLRTLFSHSHLFFRYLIASILMGFLVLVGLILFVIPGIYWGLKYQFLPCLIVDKDLGIADAFKESGQITQGVKWQLFGFSLAMIGINILGAVALGIGLLITLPVTILAHVFVYRKLSTRIMLVPVTEAPIAETKTA